MSKVILRPYDEELKKKKKKKKTKLINYNNQLIIKIYTKLTAIYRNTKRIRSDDWVFGIIDSV